MSVAGERRETGDASTLARVESTEGAGPWVWRAMLAVAGATAAAVAILGIRGDFPLNDDWSYAYSVRVLCTEGEVRFLPWTGTSLILQTAYGAALCRIAGFSFEVLRASTVVLAALGVFGFITLLRVCGARGGALTLATLVFALSPLYVNLAFTFMTDVPFTALAVCAGAWYAHGFRTSRATTLVAASVVAAASLLIRQHGIFVAAAASCAALGGLPRTDTGGGREAARAGGNEPLTFAVLRDRALGAVAAGAVPLVTFVGFHLWLTAHGAPPGYQNKVGEMQAVSITGLVNCAFRGVAYVGLFLLPLAIAVAGSVRARVPRVTGAILAALATLAIALFLRSGDLMPYLTNVLYDFGLGPLALRDTHVLGLRPPVHFGRPFQLALTVVSLTATAILIAAILLPTRSLDATTDAPSHDAVGRFVRLAALFLFAGSLVHTRYYFDRYLIVVVPFAIAALVASERPITIRPAAVVTLVLLGWYSVAGTHDYLAWNRARFGALERLRAAGVPDTAIDGGFEFNAWHLAPVLGNWPTDAQARVGQPDTLRSWWWVVDDRYVVSFRPLPRYRVHEEVRYRRWLVPGTGRVLVLERE